MKLRDQESGGNRPFLGVSGSSVLRPSFQDCIGPGLSREVRGWRAGLRTLKGGGRCRDWRCTFGKDGLDHLDLFFLQIAIGLQLLRSQDRPQSLDLSVDGLLQCGGGVVDAGRHRVCCQTAHGIDGLLIEGREHIVLLLLGQP